MDFEKRLAEIRLTPTQRRDALAALRRAEALADGLLAAGRWLRRTWHDAAASIGLREALDERPRGRAAAAGWGARHARVGPSLDD